MAEMYVELRQLKGQQQTAMGPVEVSHPMWQVLTKLQRGLTQVGMLPFASEKQRGGRRVLWMQSVLEKGDMFLIKDQRDAIDEKALQLAEQLENPQPAATDAGE